MKAKKPPPIDRRRLANDPYLRQEVATMIGNPLRAVPPSGSRVNDVETVFATATLPITGLVSPPRERRLPGWGWMGDAQAKSGHHQPSNVGPETARERTRRAIWGMLYADDMDPPQGPLQQNPYSTSQDAVSNPGRLVQVAEHPHPLLQRRPPTNRM